MEAEIIDSEVGSFPDTWTVDRVDSAFDLIQGKQVSVRNRVGDNQRPFLRTKNVYWNRLVLDDLDKMHFSAAEEERYALLPGDLFLCEGGDVGRTAIWNGELERCYIQNHLHRLRAFPGKVDPQYAVFWFWYAFAIGNLYIGRGNKTTIPNMSRSKLAELPIALPPLKEQHRIAETLSLVQQAIEQQERLIRSTTELKQALMQKLFTEGLRGEAQKETEIGLVPESWEVVKLGSLGHVGNGSTPKRTENGYWEGGTFPWLNSTKIHERFIEHADQFVTDRAKKECHLPIVPANSLLIAITGQGKTLGNIALTRIETSINQHLAYVKFNDDKMNPEFMLWYLSTLYDQLRSVAHGSGSTKGALTCSYLKSLEVPLPGKVEQEQIMQVFAQLEQKVRNAEGKRNALEDLFRTLLHELMTGKVRVGELDLAS